MSIFVNVRGITIGALNGISIHREATQYHLLARATIIESLDLKEHSQWGQMSFYARTYQGRKYNAPLTKVWTNKRRLHKIRASVSDYITVPLQRGIKTYTEIHKNSLDSRELRCKHPLSLSCAEKHLYTQMTSARSMNTLIQQPATELHTTQLINTYNKK